LIDTMKSANSCRLLDLEHDIPTSRDDVLALRRARVSRPLDFMSYLQFLSGFPSPTEDELRVRKGPTGTRPFEL
jgi:hypothetical protein